MARFLLHDFSPVWRKTSRWFLALVWLSGLVSGSAFFFLAGISDISVMRWAVGCPVSIVSLLAVTWLPFLLSALVFYLNRPCWILLLAFLKAFSICFVALRIAYAYGTAGWLVRSLVMFSDFTSLPLLIFSWLRHISGEKRFEFSGLGLLLSAVLVICCIDVRYISPILANL